MRKDEGTNRWSVRGGVAINLITTQDDKVWLLLVENLGDKVERPGIGLALATIIAVRNGVATFAHAGAEVEVGDLHDLEPPVLLDPRLGFLRLPQLASPKGEVHAEKRTARVEQ